METIPTLRSARAELTRRLEHWFELPMALLGAIWLLLLVLEFLYEATPLREAAATAIWIAFVIEFAVRFLVTPAKGLFLRRNWITAVALLLPAFRVLRFARIMRLARAGRALRAL